jgi:hypothetical protein
MDSGEFFLTFLGGIVSGVFITVSGQLLNDYLKRLKMNVEVASSTISQTPIKRSIIVGFGVSIEQGKELNDAYVRFNGKRYPWYENGLPKDKIQLLVGDEPSWFFPYSITLDYVEDISKQQNVSSIIKREARSNHGILFTVQELDTKNTVFSRCYSMPKNTPAFDLGMNQLISKISIRLIGEGIERKMSSEGDMYLKRLTVGKLENGVPSLETSNFYVEILR